MDFPSNVCIACSCCSTRPFQTFHVSNIGQSWLGSTKYVTVLVSLVQYIRSYPILSDFRPIQPRSGIEKGGIHPARYSYFRLPTHTYHRFGFSVESFGDLFPSLLSSLMLLILPHMHPR